MSTTPDPLEAIYIKSIAITLPEFRRKIQALIIEAKVRLANLYGEPECESLHHNKKNQHTSMQDCPVEKAIYEQLKENK